MEYRQRCDHCGGRISLHLQDGLEFWGCEGCACEWTIQFVLFHKGTICPVHGEAVPA